jgi:hypothetical protein
MKYQHFFATLYRASFLSFNTDLIQVIKSLNSIYCWIKHILNIFYQISSIIILKTQNNLKII